ncbi:flagellar biosynthetic protein FliO [Modestobacter sp. Leaf380]|uniref:FliO/MopB family protein n=1 Tax=Modestobacter sp. Leaf380 TaxID=1736356 RepID=UPI0007011269|nr:flagellar biosynthetic protein FliO [Modestobacter sp. Leaf380]KQS68399.1 hypothetical protein ASG41_05240 [Modestobacter sp. Leaf380]
MTWMVIRLVLTLAFVGGVLWFAARLAKKRGLGGGNGLIEVVARQRMGRSSTVSVLRVADRVLVVGTTEEHVTLLAEMDGEVVEDALADIESEREQAQAARRAAAAARSAARRPAAVGAGLDEDPSATRSLPPVPGVRRPSGAAPAVGRHGGTTGATGGTGLLAGSVFDRGAWTSVVEGLRERTVRK